MKKIAIIVDSTFLIDDNIKSREDIFIIPLSVNFENASFKEVGDKDELLEEVFKKVNKEKAIPKTSQPSVQDFLNTYEKAYNLGYDKIYGFYISSKLSGTFQGAESAKDLFVSENINVDIKNYDSLNVCVSIMAVKDILAYIDITGDITEDVIENRLEYYSNNTKTLLTVDSLEYLALGGRISSSVAAIGNLFGIKPLLEIKHGEILEHSKVRTQKNAYKRMLELFEEDVLANTDKTFYIGSTHVLSEKNASRLMNSMEKILKHKEVKYEKVFLSSLGTVIGIHVGPDSIGISWCIKND